MKNQIKKVLSLMLAIVMCMSTLVLGISAESECPHYDTLYLGKVAPTCTEQGGSRYQCQDCGEVFVEYYLEANGHTYYCVYCAREYADNEYHWCTTDPDSFDDWYYDQGSCTKTCTVCGEVEELDHIPGEPGESCGSYTCDHCGEVVNVGINNEDNHAHNYVFVPEKTIEPNCNDKDKASGYLFFRCTECGVEKKLTANGQHTLTRVLAKAPTCTEDGWVEHFVCDTCGKTFANYTDTAIAATTFDPKVEKLRHVDAEAVVADCVEKGHCELCDKDYTQDAHELETIDVTATCFNGEGTKTYCKNCDYVVYSNTEAVEHSFIVDPEGSGNEDKKATCTENGWEGKYVCEYGCGKTYGEDKEIPAAHNYVPKKYNANCTDDAYTCKECTVCGDKIEITAVEGEKADGKSHLMIPVSLPATCTENGAKGTMCLYCDEKGEWEVIEATGHNYPEIPTLHLDATCSSFAQDYYGCQNPGCKSVKSVIGTKYDTTPAGHIKYIFGITNAEDYEEFRKSDEFRAYRALGVEYYPANCTEKGRWALPCLCGATFIDDGDDVFHGDYLAGVSYLIENAIFKSEYEALDCLTGTKATMGNWCTNCKAFIGETVEVTHESLHALVNGEEPVYYTVIDDETYEYVPFLNTNFATFKQDHICNVRDQIFQDGILEFTYCVTCKEKYAHMFNGEDVRNLYFDPLKAANADPKNHVAVLVEAKEAVCSWNGTSAKKGTGWLAYCSVCEKATDAHIKTEKAHNYDASIIDLPGKVEVTCTTPGFSADVCADCGFGHVSTGSYYKALGHDFSEYLYTVDPTCDEKGYDVYKCADCDETTEKNFKDALKHKNVYGRDFVRSCLDKETDRVCIRCGETVAAECQFEIVVTAPTCTEKGFSVKTCKDCQATETFGEVDALGHDEYNTDWLYDEFTLSTYTKEGEAVGFCYTCGEKYTKVIPVLEGIAMDITVDSGIYAGANIVNGGLVEFTVALGANIELSSLVTKFVYDADILTFVDAKVESIFDVKDEAGNTTVITTATVGNSVGLALGCVTVFVDATENTASGAPVDVALFNDEIKFVTLTFRVAADAAYENKSLDGVICEAVSFENGQIKDNYGDLLVAVADCMNTYMDLEDKYGEEIYALEEATRLYEEFIADAEANGIVLTPSEIAPYEKAIDEANEALEPYYAETEAIMSYAEATLGSLVGTDVEFDNVDEFRETLMRAMSYITSEMDETDMTYVEYAVSKLGDVNYNGRMNSSDALAIRQLMFTKLDGTINDGEYFEIDVDEEGNETEVEMNYLAEADIDMDGEITLADYALLSQYLVGTITYEELVLSSQK